MDIRLTKLQAFNAMDRFLEDYYNKTSSDDIGSLLGDMSFVTQDCTADPATWDDWLDAFGTHNSANVVEAYKAMMRFLDYYRSNTSSDDVALLLKKMELDDKDIPKNAEIWNLWIYYVNQIISTPGDTRSYLVLEGK